MKLTPVFAALTATVLLSGCSQLTAPWYGVEETVEPTSTYDVAHSNAMANEKGLAYRTESSDQTHHNAAPMLVRPVETHKTVADYASQLAMGLMEHAFTLTQRDRIAIASFVRFNKSLREPTVLGNKLAESLIVELQQYGMSIVDTKLATDYAITSYGDLAFSRDADELQSELNVDYILTGTLVERASGIEVNARIIAVDSQQIAAAASVSIPQFIVAAEHYYLHGE